MELLAQLAQDPARAAIFLDVDGVLAPIVPVPEAASVPDDIRQELRRLAGRYALVACITGRLQDDARRVVGVPELTYVGNHGLELEPDADVWAAKLATFVADVDWPQVEPKGLAVALHYRNMPDEEGARRALDAIAERARAAGLIARYGRKVLEILPSVDVHKGTAVRRLLDDRKLEHALYAGDDTTDLDAFAALEPLELGVRVAVASTEGPPELTEQADIVLGAQPDVLELLRAL